MSPSIFISYRRTQIEAVSAAVAALRSVNLSVFFDIDNIDPLTDFPDAIRNNIERSHAMLIWWSSDYVESDFCMQEYRLGWQYTRRKTSDLPRRIWIINPESTTTHIYAAELNSKNFLHPPTAGSETKWAQNILGLALRLLPEGTFADESRSPREPTPTSVVLSGVPRPSTEFTGRNQEMWKIHSALHPAQIAPTAFGPSVQVAGMGGVGKTELVAKYATEFGMSYPAGVFWLNLSGFETVKSQSDADAAWVSAIKVCLTSHPWVASRKLKFKDENGTDLSRLEIQYQISQLIGDLPSLWVFDNLPILRPEELRDKLISSWFTQNPIARNIITTRDARRFLDSDMVSLEFLQEVDALRLLGRFRPLGTEADLARELVREVGGHTLALVLLGHRLKYASDGYAFVLESIRDHDLIKRVEELSNWATEQLQLGEKIKGILATFASSFDRVSDAEAVILAAAATCASNVPIPYRLIWNHYGDLVGARTNMVNAKDKFDASLGKLIDASLLRRRERHGIGISVEIHNVTATAFWAHSKLSPGDVQSRLAGSIIYHDTFPDEVKRDNNSGTDSDTGKDKTERGGDLFAPHIAQLVNNAPAPAALRLALRYLFLEGYEELMESRSIDIAIRTYGPTHPYTLITKNNIAFKYMFAERSEYDRFYDDVFDEFKLQLGADHSMTLIVALERASKLKGRWFRSGGKREFLESAKNIESQVLGAAQGRVDPDRNLILVTMKLLSSTLWCLGELEENAKLDKEILAIYSRTLNQEDPRLARAKNNYSLSSHEDSTTRRMFPLRTWINGLIGAGRVGSQGDQIEMWSGLPLDHFDKRGFRTYSVRWGPEHPEILIAMSSVAFKRGDVETANNMLELARINLLSITANKQANNTHDLLLSSQFAYRVEDIEYAVRKLNSDRNTLTRVMLENETITAGQVFYTTLQPGARSLGIMVYDAPVASKYYVVDLMEAAARNYKELGDLNTAIFFAENSVELQKRFYKEPRRESLEALEEFARLKSSLFSISSPVSFVYGWPVVET